MSAKEIELAAESIAKKDLSTSCNTLDKLFDESYRNKHRDAAGTTDAAKDWGEYYKKELIPLTQKLVDSKLLPGLSTGDAADKQLRVQGTFKTANEKFLVVADCQSGDAHEVYLQDKDGKFIRGQLNPSQSSPDNKFLYDMSQRFDSIDAARAGQQAKPAETPASFMPPAFDVTPPSAAPADTPSSPAADVTAPKK